MSEKKVKEEILFEGLLKQLNELQNSDKKDIKKISDIFGRFQEVKGINVKEIEKLFNTAISVAQKDSWEFIIETFSRLYYRKDVKNKEKVLSFIEDEVKKKVSTFIEKNEIDEIFYALNNNDNSLLKNKLKQVDIFCKDNNFPKTELISYLYVLFVHVSIKYYSNTKAILKAQRILFTTFADRDKHDSYFVKNMKRSFLEEKSTLKFSEVTYLYEGIEEDLDSIQAENEHRKETIKERNLEISGLNKEIELLKKEILDKQSMLDEKEKQLTEQKGLNDKADRRNEFNENLYKQQYISLKNELIEKLKNDLQPEIEGLETIAEALDEVQKERIQRRITRIYKLLQKLGE